MTSLRISEHSSKLATSYLPAFESVFALGETHPNYQTIWNCSRPPVETFSSAMLFLSEFYPYEWSLVAKLSTITHSFLSKNTSRSFANPFILTVQLCHPMFSRLTLMVPWALLAPWLFAGTEEWCFAMRGAAADPRGYWGLNVWPRARQLSHLSGSVRVPAQFDPCLAPTNTEI